MDCGESVLDAFSNFRIKDWTQIINQTTFLFIFNILAVAFGVSYKVIARLRRTRQMLDQMDWDNFIFKVVVVIPTVMAGLYMTFFVCGVKAS